MKKKGCSSCYWFFKVKHWNGAIGLCEFYDGKLLKEFKDCGNWKGIKFDRNKEVE